MPTSTSWRQFWVLFVILKTIIGILIVVIKESSFVFASVSFIFLEFSMPLNVPLLSDFTLSILFDIESGVVLTKIPFKKKN